MKPVSFILGVILLFSACGERAQLEEVAVTIPVDTLIPVDSIGIFMGDSCYMFGAIADYAPILDGGVAILDRMTGEVSVFDGSGSFIRSFSRMGEGPGEFQFPIRLIYMPSDMYVVLEFLNGNVTLFDSDGVYVDRWQMDGMGVFPLDTYAFDDSSFVSYNFSMVMDESDFHIRFSLWRYNVMTGEVLTEFFTWDGDARPSTDFEPAYVTSTSDERGTLYLAHCSDDSWMVQILDGDGTLLDTLMAFPERERFSSEPDSGVVPGAQYVMYMYAEDENSGTDMMTTNAPDQHPLISGLGIGPDGNIWARRGGLPASVWDVVSSSGAHLREVFVMLEDTVQLIDLKMNGNGILSFNHWTEDYHQVYVMDLQSRLPTDPELRSE